jgi:hypothetical protein
MSVLAPGPISNTNPFSTKVLPTANVSVPAIVKLVSMALFFVIIIISSWMSLRTIAHYTHETGELLSTGWLSLQSITQSVAVIGATVIGIMAADTEFSEDVKTLFGRFPKITSMLLFVYSIIILTQMSNAIRITNRRNRNNGGTAKDVMWHRAIHGTGIGISLIGIIYSGILLYNGFATSYNEKMKK